MADGDTLLVLDVRPDIEWVHQLPLLGRAQSITDSLGGRLTGLLAGGRIGDAAADLSRYADEVLVVESPVFEEYHPDVLATLVEDACRETDPDLILLGHTLQGMDLAPRLALRLEAWLVTNCLDVVVARGGRELVCERPVHRGRLRARLRLSEFPAVITLQPGGAVSPQERNRGEVRSLGFEPPTELSMTITGVIGPDTTSFDVDITRADVVVAAGRGIGEPDAFVMIEELAEALGGVAACSRPLVDMGWVGSERQVGISGKTVTPRLYVACGISGAFEHIVGMKDSRVVVAVNTDPEAPIFRYARYGIVGDLNEVVPALTEVVRSVRGQSVDTLEEEG